MVTCFGKTVTCEPLAGSRRGVAAWADAGRNRRVQNSKPRLASVAREITVSLSAPHVRRRTTRMDEVIGRRSFHSGGRLGRLDRVLVGGDVARVGVPGVGIGAAAVVDRRSGATGVARVLGQPFRGGLAVPSSFRSDHGASFTLTTYPRHRVRNRRGADAC